jgi:hypothetical protein
MMGEAEINLKDSTITISSHIITYGNMADEAVTESIREEIESMWNEPAAVIFYQNNHFRILFRITAELKKYINELEVLQNTDPRNNYFRIEKFVHGNISFVDGLGSNTGYFLLENLYKGSTTSAHEYGHTLGLPHPQLLDIRGEGVPGIMYPRGTLVDSKYQYDPNIRAGLTGGTMHPMHRKVRQEDIDDLKLNKLLFRNHKAIVGEFTNIYHWDHGEYGSTEVRKPPIFG